MEKLSSPLKVTQQKDENSKNAPEPAEPLLRRQLNMSAHHYTLLLKRSCFINVHC